MGSANSVAIEGRVGSRIYHYPAVENEKKRKKEFFLFEIGNRDGYFQIQCYESVARKALELGIKEGQWVFVAGLLRSTNKKAQCGAIHRFVNIVAGRLDLREASPNARPEFTDEESLGEPPRVF